MRTIPETISFLEEYNKWRRGDETISMPDQFEVDVAIDDAVRLLRELAAERDQLRAEAERSKEQQTDDAKSANETIEFLKSRAARAEADAKRERITWEAVDQCANNLAKSLEEAEAELAEARKDTQVTLNKLGDTLRELATERALTAKMLARFVWLNSQASGYGTEDSHEGNTWRFDGAYAALEDLADAEIDAAMKEDRE